jgi:MYND finger
MRPIEPGVRSNLCQTLKRCAIQAEACDDHDCAAAVVTCTAVSDSNDSNNSGSSNSGSSSSSCVGNELISSSRVKTVRGISNSSSRSSSSCASHRAEDDATQKQTLQQQPCAHCGKLTKKRCRRCQAVFYCSSAVKCSASNTLSIGHSVKQQLLRQLSVLVVLRQPSEVLQ